MTLMHRHCRETSRFPLLSSTTSRGSARPHTTVKTRTSFCLNVVQRSAGLLT
jgi:hypothetical protein